MAQSRQSKKRPCRICRKWFVPNPRLGDRQKTCGCEECKRQWHIKKCSEWNNKNRAYFRDIYLSRKLQAEGAACPSKKPPPASCPPQEISTTTKQLAFSLTLPRDVIQEVMGSQQLIIIEYVAQVLVNSFKELMHQQRIEIYNELKQVPLRPV